MELIAVENLVFCAAGAASGHTAPPSLHGVPYDNMVDDPATAPDEAHMFMPHTGARTHPGMWFPGGARKPH